MSDRKKETPAKRKRSAKEKTQNPVIFAENFGPIKSARDIEIKPLTIFVGPSSQGKTYFSIVLATLFRFIHNVSGECMHMQMRMDRHQQVDLFNKKKDDDRVKFWRDDYTETIKHENAQLHENIVRNIGADSAKSLKRSRSRGNFKIGFDFGKWNFTADLNDESHTLSLKKQNSQFMANLTSWVELGRRIGEPIFLPAGRSGLTQSYHVIAATLLTRATAAEAFDMPTIRGVDATFLQNNLRLVADGEAQSQESSFLRRAYSLSIIRRRKRGEGRIVEYLENVQRRIFGGLVKINADSPKHSRTMDLHTENGLKIPIRVGASMLQELAPFFLQVQQLANVGDTVIIEEPESHLHPDAQRKIAETIAALVKMGMKFVVTTHSPIFLEQIELEIKKSTLSKKDVALYQFNQSNPKPQVGSTTKKIDYDKENGFIVDEYEDVFSELHNDLVIALEDDLIKPLKNDSIKPLELE